MDADYKTVENLLFDRGQERTLIDKLLDRRDVERIKKLIAKEALTREELLELLYLITGIETKLVNYTEDDRYILGKYYAWIRDFVNAAELFYDVQSQIREAMLKYDEDTKKQLTKTLEYIRGLLLHDVKFAIDVFLFLSRSTLSIDAKAFEMLLTSKMEYEYKTVGEPIPQPSGIQSFLRGGR